MWLYCILLLSLLVGSHCVMNSTNCLEKEQSLGALDLAKESIDKAKLLFPNCSDNNSGNPSECGEKEKGIALLNLAKDLITNAKNNYPKNNYPTCPDVTPPAGVEPMDCSDVLRQGHNTSGVYMVWPRSRLSNNKNVHVYCDMDTEGGGWTVIQRRSSSSRTENFYQDWENYKRGFGDLDGEFWLGNDNIFSLTNQGNYEVRFDLTDFEGEKRFAVYKSFWIESEEAGYKMHVKDYNGDAGNSLEYENGQVFSTKDRQNEKVYGGVPCTTSRETGWWFFACNKANVNGVPRKYSNTSSENNLYWKEWKAYASLASASMKLRRI